MSKQISTKISRALLKHYKAPTTKKNGQVFFSINFVEVKKS